MTGTSVVERMRLAIGRLQAMGAPISLASICEQVRLAGDRLSQSSILRNEEARALYLAHRTWKPGPRKRFRGHFREASDAEIAQARRYWRLSRIQLVAVLLTREAENRLLTQELTALHALERRGELVAPAEGPNPDRSVAAYHRMLAKRRAYLAGYWPEMLKAIMTGEGDAP